ncbi:MAG: hypothetical protein IPH55_16655 [Betaproteobacteria bacterium]|nr:hypothetical protein [Betaproteobacteria bacterium]
MAIDYAVLKAAILAETDAGFVAARDQGNNTLMARFYADAAVPTYYVWRSSYTPDQIAAAIEVGITQLDALTQSKRDVLLWWAERSHNPASSQAAIDDMCGSQNTLKAAVKDGGKRTVNKGERLFATGTGSLAAPGTAAYEGTLTSEDIRNALAS